MAAKLARNRRVRPAGVEQLGDALAHALFRGHGTKRDQQCAVADCLGDQDRGPRADGAGELRLRARPRGNPHRAAAERGGELKRRREPGRLGDTGQDLGKVGEGLGQFYL